MCPGIRDHTRRSDRPKSIDSDTIDLNGLALSGTIHWTFDRGLLSPDDDLTILKAEGRVPFTIDRMIAPNGWLRVPGRPDLRPHPMYLEYHRKTVFKG